MLRVLFRLCDKNNRDLYYFDPEAYMNSEIQIADPAYPGLLMALTRFRINYYIKNPKNPYEILISGTAVPETKILNTLYFRFAYDEVHKNLFLESFEELPKEYQDLSVMEMPQRDKPHMMYLAVRPMENNVALYSTFIGGIDYDSHVLSVFNFELEGDSRIYEKEIH